MMAHNDTAAADIIDFSEALLEQSGEDILSLNGQPGKSNTGQKSKKPVCNRNISDVIAQITDDGPQCGPNRSVTGMSMTDKQKKSDEIVMGNGAGFNHNGRECDRVKDNSEPFAELFKAKKKGSGSATEATQKYVQEQIAKASRGMAEGLCANGFSADADTSLSIDNGQAVDTGANGRSAPPRLHDVDNNTGKQHVSGMFSRLRPSWVFVVLSAMFSLLMCLLFFQIRIESAEIKDAFMSYQQEMAQRSQQLQAGDSLLHTGNAVESSSLTRLEQKITHLSEEIGNVKTGYQTVYQTIDSKLEKKLDVLSEKLNDLGQVSATSHHSGSRVIHHNDQVKMVANAKAGVSEKTTRRISSVSSRQEAGFSVNLSSFSEREMALSEARRLQNQHINARVSRVRVNRQTLYRVSIDGFPRRGAAEAYLQKMEKMGMNGWVQPNK